MAQEIKIGVGANASGAEAAVKRVDDAAAGAADSVRQISDASKEAARDLDRVAAAAKRVAATQAMLKRELGRDVSVDDARTFNSNFDRMRSGKGLGSRRLKAFDGPEEWYLGHSGSFTNAAHAAHHRRFVLATGMQGTADSRQYGAPPMTPPAGPPRGPGGDGQGDAPDGFGGGVQRAKSMAMGFVKGGLALAGISSIMGMASSALDSSTEEATGVDTLKRRMGDLGVDFERLRGQARAAGSGLGVTYLESQRLAQQFAATAGNMTAAEGLGGGARAGIGMSRAYGLEPEQGVQFMATMRRLGLAGDDQQTRRLALMIADGVAKGGYAGKVDEVLEAVANYSSQVARSTLSAPNVGAYAGALSSLTSTGRPGLDPAGAAGILNRADSAVRGGGGYGEAGMNFVYAAMRKDVPDPLQAKALWSGGLFGTTRNTFGPETMAGDYYRQQGMATPELTDETTFERIRDLINSRIAPRYRSEAMQNLTGLSTPQEAMALLGMSTDTLNKSQRLVQRAGIEPKASSIAGIAQVANAGPTDLRRIYESVWRRGDVSASDRERMEAGLRSGDIDELKTAIVAVIGTKEQEESEGTKVRQSVTDLKDELTRVGGMLLTPINLIRDGMVAVADHFNPGFRAGIESGKRTWERDKASDGVDWEAKVKARGEGDAKWYESRKATLRAGYDRMKEERGGAAVDLDRLAPLPPEGWEKSTDPTLRKNYEAGMALRKYIRSLENPGGPGASPQTREADSLWRRVGSSATGGSPPAGGARPTGGVATVRAREQAAMEWLMKQGRSRDVAAGIVGNLTAESSMDPLARGDGGKARGLAQWHPDRWAKFEAWAKKKGYDVDSYGAQLAFVNYEMGTADGGYADRYLRPGMGAAAAAEVVGKKYERPGIWGRRTAEAQRLMGETPLPDGVAAAGPAATPVSVNVNVAGEGVLRDTDGRPRGTMVLNAFVPAQPAGVQ